MCVPRCMYVHRELTVVPGGQKTLSDSLELKLQAVVSLLVWMHILNC